MKKEIVHNLCIQNIEEKIKVIADSITSAQDSANEEGKSSMGDKYETGRAMMQLEIENKTAQLMETKETLDFVKRINPKQKSQVIGLGSLVKTNNGYFYLAVGIGSMKVEKQSIFVISMDSPIGKLLKGKEQNMSFDLNGRKFVIEEIS
ncbi:MAG: 3-oxoacyl-ACP synthase [Cytophagales bacterium]|nr:3-oxoacyl-ACP synthase [Cytophagales bacterium]